MTQKLRLMMLALLMFVTSAVFAQPPIGGNGGGGGLGNLIPNVEVPDIEELELKTEGGIDIDVASQQLLATVTARDGQALQNRDFDANTFKEMMDNYEVPENWSEINFSGEMPSKDEILAMANELPIDINNLDIGLSSSPEATSAIVGYASTMLGLGVTPLYAGVYGDSDLDSSQAAQDTMAQVYSQLDGDMQSFLSQAENLSGVTYWALLENGMALVYTGDCDFDQCTIDQNMVQVEITKGSLGAYAIYSDTLTSSSDQAKALVQSTFPYLASIELSETESSIGTAFFAFDIDIDTQEVTIYYAGVYGAETGQSIVYAVSGIGDAYINVLLGGS